MLKFQDLSEDFSLYCKLKNIIILSDDKIKKRLSGVFEHCLSCFFFLSLMNYKNLRFYNVLLLYRPLLDKILNNTHIDPEQSQLSLRKIKQNSTASLVFIHAAVHAGKTYIINKSITLFNEIACQLNQGDIWSNMFVRIFTFLNSQYLCLRKYSSLPFLIFPNSK